MGQAQKQYTEEEKIAVLTEWKKSGKTIHEFSQTSEVNQSTLYDWKRKHGDAVAHIEAEPTQEQPKQADTQETQDTPEPDLPQPKPEHKEPNGCTEPSEADTAGETEGESEDVIIKDRVDELAPAVVPQPAQPQTEEKTPGSMNTVYVVGGVIVAGAIVYLLVKSLKKPKQAQPQQTQEVNPFDGYTTIDKYSG